MQASAEPPRPEEADHPLNVAALAVARDAVLDSNGRSHHTCRYAPTRQATDGDAEGERPGFFDFVGGLKYDAWASNRGVNADEAMRRYIAEVEAFAREHGFEL